MHDDLDLIQVWWASEYCVIRSSLLMRTCLDGTCFSVDMSRASKVVNLVKVTQAKQVLGKHFYYNKNIFVVLCIFLYI